MIIRENYLAQIREFYHENNIKVLMGVRRVGKSTLIHQIILELKESNIDDDHIYIIDFDLYENNIYTNTSKLTTYIESLIKDDKKYYIFFDEIQNVIGWEKVINSFNSTQNVSIFVTGSNCDLVSSEYTSFINKYISFNIYPLSFKEICSLKNITNPDDCFNFISEYLKWGGMPQLLEVSNEHAKQTSIIDIYNSIVVNDIVKRFNVKDVALLNRIVNYIFSNIAKPFAVNDMARYLDDYTRKVSLDTMYNYLEYISKTSLVTKAERYDLVTKRTIAGKYKYYLTDFSSSNIFRTINDEKRLLENLIFNELVSRGYKVNLCNISNRDIDFIATKDKEVLYFQVYPNLQDDKLRNKVFNDYKYINDNYPKYVISYDKEDFSREGIIHVNVLDFLLSQEI